MSFIHSLHLKFGLNQETESRQELPIVCMYQVLAPVGAELAPSPATARVGGAARGRAPDTGAGREIGTGEGKYLQKLVK